jgi:hypothetical protein
MVSELWLKQPVAAGIDEKINCFIVVTGVSRFGGH